MESSNEGLIGDDQAIKAFIGDHQVIKVFFGSLIPRPSAPPVFDRLQYAKTEGVGLGNLLT